MSDLSPLVCKTCGIEKPVEEYHSRIRAGGVVRHGRSCKECVRARDRARWPARRGVLKGYPKPAREVGSKACTKCGVVKPVADFYVKSRGEDGRPYYQGPCKDCFKKRVSERQQANPTSHFNATTRRRIRFESQFVEPIDWLAVAHRDNWTCQLCGFPVRNKQASIDHIIPLARGGVHSMLNVQLAHKTCNKRKSDKTPDEWVAYRDLVGIPYARPRADA